MLLKELLLDDLVVPENYGLAVGCHPKDVMKTDKEDKVITLIKELHDEKKLFAVGEVGKLTIPIFPKNVFHSFQMLISIFSLT